MLSDAATPHNQHMHVAYTSRITGQVRATVDYAAQVSKSLLTKWGTRILEVQANADAARRGGVQH